MAQAHRKTASVGPARVKNAVRVVCDAVVEAVPGTSTAQIMSTSRDIVSAQVRMIAMYVHNTALGCPKTVTAAAFKRSAPTLDHAMKRMAWRMAESPGFRNRVQEILVHVRDELGKPETNQEQTSDQGV